jgi:hypothetical protein
MSYVACTARDFIGMARVTRHQRPQVGAVGWTGIGNALPRTSSSAAAVTPAARRPAMPSPSNPTHSTMATPSPSQPAQPWRAPNAMKRAVATICQTMFWNASSPATQPEVKLTMVNGSRRMGR